MNEPYFYGNIIVQTLDITDHISTTILKTTTNISNKLPSVTLRKITLALKYYRLKRFFHLLAQRHHYN